MSEVQFGDLSAFRDNKILQLRKYLQKDVYESITNV